MADAVAGGRRHAGMMRWRSVLRWMPTALFVVLFGLGLVFVVSNLGTSDVLLLAAADGSQVGMMLMLLGAAAGVIALIQGIIVAGRLRSSALGMLTRLACVFLLVLSLPAGCMLLLMAAFTTVNGYRLLDVPGHQVAVRTLVWHHQSQDVLEGDGLFFHSARTCPGALSVDGYDPFAKGEFDVISRNGHDILRFAQRPGGAFTGEVILGSSRGDDMSSLY